MTNTVKKYPLKVKDVVALGLKHGECPVGLVTELSQFGPKLALFSWLSGYFDAEHAVSWESIIEIRWTGYDEKESGHREYDCQPLGHFQTRWIKDFGPKSQTEGEE